MDRIRLPGLGAIGRESADTRAQLEARADFNARMAADLTLNLQQHIDGLAALTAQLAELVRRTPSGARIGRDYIFTHRNTTDVQQYQLLVPPGNWLLERIIWSSNSAAGSIGVNSVGIRGLVGAHIIYPPMDTISALSSVDLVLPINSRNLEMVPQSAQPSGATTLIVLILTEA